MNNLRPNINLFPEKIKDDYDLFMEYFNYPATVKTFDEIVSQYLKHLSKPVRVLEIGIGTGNFAYHLEQVGNSRYQMVGIDSSSDMINELKRKFPNMMAHVMSVDNFAFKNQDFDVVVSSAGPIRFNYYGPPEKREVIFESYLPEMEQVKEALRRIHHHLRPGGLMVLSINSGPNDKGGFKSTANEMVLRDGKRYTKEEKITGDVLSKKRRMYDAAGRVVWEITHQFSWLSFSKAEKMLADFGFHIIGPDTTFSWHTSAKK